MEKPIRFEDSYYYGMQPVEVAYIKNFLGRFDKSPNTEKSPLSFAKHCYEYTKLYGITGDDKTELEFIIISLEESLIKFLNKASVEIIVKPLNHWLDYDSDLVWKLNKNGSYLFVETEFRPATILKDASLLKELFDLLSKALKQDVLLKVKNEEVGFTVSVEKLDGTILIKEYEGLLATAMTLAMVRFLLI